MGHASGLRPTPSVFMLLVPLPVGDGLSLPLLSAEGFDARTWLRQRGARRPRRVDVLMGVRLELYADMDSGRPENERAMEMFSVLTGSYLLLRGPVAFGKLTLRQVMTALRHGGPVVVR